MPFNPMFGWIPEKDAKLVPSTKKKNNVPVSPGWAAARQEQLNARTEGRQVAPNVATPIAPKAGQMHGPAYGQGSPNDVWSPQGFGVTGLKDIFGMNLPTPGVPRPSQPTGTPAMGGATDTVNELGVKQSMRPMSSASAAIDMNRSFEDLLGDMGVSGYSGGGQFSSNNLFTRESGDNDKFDSAAPGITGNRVEDFGGDGGAAAASSTDKSQFTPMSGKEGRIEGGSDRSAGISMADALADKEGINSYMSKFSSGDRDRAARRAFLDADNSMSGLKARDAVNGVVYAGGEHRIKSGDGTQVIDPADARQIASGKAQAQDFLKKKTEDTVAAIKQAPTEITSEQVKRDFGRSEPISATMPSDIGGSVEFNSNNENTAPAFGQNGGYKSGIKKINTSMPNMFG